MDSVKNLRKNSVNEKSVENKFNLLSEKVRILQSSLDSICLEIHKKSVESIRLQNILDDTQKNIISAKEEHKKSLLNLEKTYQEKVKQLGIEKIEEKVNSLNKERLVLLDKLDCDKNEYSERAKSFNVIINFLSEKKKGLELIVKSLQEDISKKIIDLQSVTNSCKINKEKYIKEENIAIKKLKDAENKKENIEEEISQLSTKKDELESKWEELKEFQKYISLY